MGRRLWLRVGFTLLLAARAEATPPDRLNFVFIAVDDLRPALGCYGDPIARTPAIDRLAESGVRFDRAYAQFPGCNPSRSSLLTGRYPAATGVFDNQASFRARLPDAITLPEYFRSHGYVTLREVPFDRDADVSWDTFVRRYNADLANDFGNLVNRTVSMANRYLGGERPAPSSGGSLAGVLSESE